MPTITPLSPSRDVHVVLDWSAIVPISADLPSPDMEMSSVLDWVRNYPNRSQLHIFLQRSLPDASSRRLQNMLQALGCKVTTRYTSMVGAQ